MAEIDVKKLRELAKAALWTGDWYDAGCNTLMCTYPENSGDLSGESDEIAHPTPLGLVEYMAAAQPKVILALCDRLEAAEKDAERWRAVRDTLSGAVGAGIEVNDERLYYQEPVAGEEVRIFWYPHTPVGFCEVHGSTLDGAADELIAQRQGEGS